MHIERTADSDTVSTYQVCSIGDRQVDRGSE